MRAGIDTSGIEGASVADGGPPRRSDREILLATRPFAVEQRARSLRLLLVTVLALAGASAVTVVAERHVVRATAAVIVALLVVRTFIFYHDFMHGALLRGSRVARAFFHLFGMLVLAPPRFWRTTHNHHHAHNAKLPGEAIGAFPLLSRRQFEALGRLERFDYRLERHPLTIVLGYGLIFLHGQCVAALLEDARRYWDAALALALHLALACALYWLGGWATLLYVLLLPMWIATCAGSYLFYVQHTARGIRIPAPERWTFVVSALDASTYLEAGPVARWFTGNIGYHHVHHLNPRIPFYRLPEAMAAIPELQTPIKTNLSLRTGWDALHLGLWDEAAGEMAPIR